MNNIYDQNRIIDLSQKISKYNENVENFRSNIQFADDRLKNGKTVNASEFADQFSDIDLNGLANQITGISELDFNEIGFKPDWPTEQLFLGDENKYLSIELSQNSILGEARYRNGIVEAEVLAGPEGTTGNLHIGDDDNYLKVAHDQGETTGKAKINAGIVDADVLAGPEGVVGNLLISDNDTFLKVAHNQGETTGKVKISTDIVDADVLAGPEGVAANLLIGDNDNFLKVAHNQGVTIGEVKISNVTADTKFLAGPEGNIQLNLQTNGRYSKSIFGIGLSGEYDLAATYNTDTGQATLNASTEGELPYGNFYLNLKVDPSFGTSVVAGIEIKWGKGGNSSSTKDSISVPGESLGVSALLPPDPMVMALDKDIAENRQSMVQLDTDPNLRYKSLFEPSRIGLDPDYENSEDYRQYAEEKAGESPPDEAFIKVTETEAKKQPPTDALETEGTSQHTPLKTSLNDDDSETGTGKTNAEFAMSGEFVYDTGQNPFNAEAKEEKTDQGRPEELKEVLKASDEVLNEGLEKKIDQALENGQLDGEELADAVTPSFESTLTGIGSDILGGVTKTFTDAGTNLASLVTTGGLPKPTPTTSEDVTNKEPEPPKLNLAGEAANAGGQVLVDAIADEQGWSDFEQFTAKVAMATAAKGIGNVLADGNFSDGNSLKGNISEIGIGMGTEVVWDKIGEQLGMSPEELGQTKAAVTVLSKLHTPTKIGIDTGLTALGLNDEIGSTAVANQIVAPESAEAGTLGAVSGAVGGVIGTSFGTALGGPVEGTFGSYVGSAVGTMVGNVVGNAVFGSDDAHPKSYAHVEFNETTGEFEISNSWGGDGMGGAMGEGLAQNVLDTTLLPTHNFD